MARPIRSVAVLGATGNLGPIVVQALREAQPPFEAITVLTRSSSHPPGTFPDGVTVKTVDYTSHSSLAAALAGVDAVVSTVGTEHAPAQHAVVDAAADAGVRLFIPAEFGLASNNTKFVRDGFTIFATKVAVQEHLEKLRQEGRMDYVLFFTSMWLDWCMGGFWIDLKGKKVQLWDGGVSPLSLTTRASIAKVIVRVLREGTGGKTEIRIKDVNISQKRVYELATEVLGADGWEVTELDTEKVTRTAMKNLDAGTATLDDIYNIVKRAFMGGEQYDVPWTADEDDSEAMGLKSLSDTEVKDLIRKVAESS